MYNVVFKYTKEAGGYAGVITWTAYLSKEHFNECWNALSEEAKKKEMILKEGISEKECIKLSEETPPICHFNASIQEVNRVFNFIPSMLPCKR